jgi:hypothetical protein
MLKRLLEPPRDKMNDVIRAMVQSLVTRHLPMPCLFPEKLMFCQVPLLPTHDKDYQHMCLQHCISITDSSIEWYACTSSSKGINIPGKVGDTILKESQ